MKPAAGASVNFSFVETRSQLFGGAAGACGGPPKTRGGGPPVTADAHQAMPKAGSRNQLDAVDGLPAVFEKLIEGAADKFDQIVRIQFFDVAKGGEDAIAVRLRTFDLSTLFIEEPGSDA